MGINESSFKYVIEVRFFALKYVLHVFIPLNYVLNVPKVQLTYPYLT